MLDADLGRIYGVETKELTSQEQSQ